MPAEEKIEAAQEEVFANGGYVKTSGYSLPDFDLREVSSLLGEKEKELEDYVSVGDIPEVTISRMKMVVEGLRLLLTLLLAQTVE